jgi:methylmalonyl-CoA carboxyltransferase large subunit
MSQTAAQPAEKTIAGLMDVLADLTARVQALEAEVASMPRPGDTLDDDVLLAITAACAAYLGKRATVKVVHLRRDQAWVKLGRSDVQHSHTLSPGRR